MQSIASNEYRYWKILRAIAFTLLIFLAFINLMGLLAVGLKALLVLTKTDPVTAEVGYQLFYAAGYLSAFMLPVIFLRKMIRKAGFAYQPMRTTLKLSPWLLLILFAGISVILAAAYINTVLVNIFSFADFSQLLPDATANRTWYSAILNFLVICLVPAVCEEFLFRGAILSNLLPFGRTQAIFISALLFGLMHQNVAQFFYAFCAGIILGLVYERTGSIWNCMFLHLVNNFFSTFESDFASAFGNKLSPIVLIVLEAFVFAVGLVSAVVLIVHFAPRKQTFREGIFGKSIPADDSYCSYPVSAKQRVKLFFNAPMIVFLILVVVEAVLVLVLLPFLT